MTAILDLPTVKSRTHLLSIEEYHALGKLGFLSKRTELIEGVVLQKMPKSPKHATMVKKIFQFFMKSLPQGCHVISEQPITLSRSEPEPDISVISGTIEDYSESHPTTAELVMEVSLSTLAEDREMANIYAEALIPEYWLFNLNNSTVEVYIKPRNGRYSEMKTYSKSETVIPKFDDSLKVSLENLF
ncbi:MAG TPA: Uma2 family endonuclease [Leptospiraceae bacterium]|nr:Uma2 family endonuclease [Leptospiraceae bacterium]